MSTIPGAWTLPFNRALSQAAIVVPKPRNSAPKGAGTLDLPGGPTVPVGPEEGVPKANASPEYPTKAAAANATVAHAKNRCLLLNFTRVPQWFVELHSKGSNSAGLGSRKLEIVRPARAHAPSSRKGSRRGWEMWVKVCADITPSLADQT